MALEKYESYNKLFTDGAKDSTTVSMAVYDCKARKGYGYKLPHLTSISTAEGHAIKSALDYIEAEAVEKWLVISDSMSILKALDNPRLSTNTSYFIFISGKSTII